MIDTQKTKNIGKLAGPVLLFGGVYSNLQALQAMQQQAAQLGIPAANIVCTGDVIGYCAQPEACVQLMQSWGVHCIAGNVELNLRDEADDCGCNFNEGSRCDVFSRQWYPYAKAALSAASMEWIRALPEFIRFEYAGKSAFVLHGSYFNTSEFIFKSTDWAVKQANFEATRSELIVAGHCGLPFAERRTTLTQNEPTLQWLNPGVIGMPANDGTRRVWYALLQEADDEIQLQIRSLDYDADTAARHMQDKPLPPTYAQTLLTGLWDNCEILPEVETARQGRPLSFV